MPHVGTAAFNPSPSTYKVYRNVKDYGAVGDGVHDDTAVSYFSIWRIRILSLAIRPSMLLFLVSIGDSQSTSY